MEKNRKITPLCRNNDFRRAYTKGKSFVGRFAVLYVRKNGGNETRVGITTSKKVGNAVMRNRSRRVLREAFRSLPLTVKDGYDIVLVARGRTPHAKSTQAARELKGLLQSSGAAAEEKADKSGETT